MKTLVFAGSTRADSLNKKLAREAARHLPGATYIDLADYPMPLYDGDTEATKGLPEHARALKQLIREHDAIWIASPEYNGSFPAIVKNLVDWVTRPDPGESHSIAFRGKIIGLLSTSPGPSGGKRGLRHLRELFEMIGSKVLTEQVAIAKGTQGIAADGHLVRPEDEASLDALVRATVEASVAQGV